jgi:hypothetical protein
MAADMTLETRRALLTEGTRTAVLGTAREDGRPHAAPIALVLDDGGLRAVRPRRARDAGPCRPNQGSSLRSGWVNIEMTASTRRTVPMRMSTGGDCDPLRCPEELTIPPESSSRIPVR